jgi:hypothetical protein
MKVNYCYSESSVCLILDVDESYRLRDNGENFTVVGKFFFEKDKTN